MTNTADLQSYQIFNHFQDVINKKSEESYAKKTAQACTPGIGQAPALAAPLSNRGVKYASGGAVVAGLVGGTSLIAGLTHVGIAALVALGLTPLGAIVIGVTLLILAVFLAIVAIFKGSNCEQREEPLSSTTVANNQNNGDLVAKNSSDNSSPLENSTPKQREEPLSSPTVANNPNNGDPVDKNLPDNLSLLKNPASEQREEPSSETTDDIPRKPELTVAWDLDPQEVDDFFEEEFQTARYEAACKEQKNPTTLMFKAYKFFKKPDLNSDPNTQVIVLEGGSTRNHRMSLHLGKYYSQIWADREKTLKNGQS